MAMRLQLATGAVLALTALLPPAPAALAALAAIILLGVPHGALDGEVARTLLRPRYKVGWFAVFSLPYLALSALVLLAWHAVPAATLAAFLAASTWHFGTEETGSHAASEVIAAGGLPIGVSVLAHPAATAAIFGTVSQVAMPQPPGWLWLAAVGWLALAALHAARLLRARRWRRLAARLALAGTFLVLPPLAAFAIYFVCVHAPAHVSAVVRDRRRRAPRVLDGWSAAWRAAPVTALTLLLGAGLWPLYHGPADARLLCLTLQGLAALTLPHMLFEVWTERRLAAGSRQPAPAAPSRALAEAAA